MTRCRPAQVSLDDFSDSEEDEEPEPEPEPVGPCQRAGAAVVLVPVMLGAAACGALCRLWW